MTGLAMQKLRSQRTAHCPNKKTHLIKTVDLKISAQESLDICPHPSMGTLYDQDVNNQMLPPCIKRMTSSARCGGPLVILAAQEA